MTSSELFNYLSGEIPAIVIKEKISTVVAQWATLKLKKGTSLDIDMAVGSDKIWNVFSNHLEHLLKDFIEGHLNALEVEYLASCLELCEDFQISDQNVIEVVSVLASPEINYALTKKSAQDLLKELTSHHL